MRASISSRACDLLGVGGAHELVLLAGEAREVGPPDGLAEVLPQPGLGAADGEVLAVPGVVHRVVRVRAAEEARAPAGGEAVAPEEAHVRGGGEQGHRRVQVGDVDVLALARALAGEERQHDAEGAVHARPRVVGDDVERDLRLAVGLADQAEHPGQRQIVHVVGGQVAVRPAMAEARERAVDEAGVDGAHGLVVGAEPLHHLGPEPLHEDVGLGGEAPEHLLRLGLLQVEGDRALVPVDVREGRPPPLVGVLGVAGRRLDLQHVGAHVGEHHARQLGRGHARQFQDRNAVEHSHGESPCRATPGAAAGTTGTRPAAGAPRPRTPDRAPGRSVRARGGRWS